MNNTKRNMRILVVGATGGSGRATVERLLEEGYEVTAFSRNASRLKSLSERLTTIDADASNANDVERAVKGHDAVIVTLGIAENPLRVRFLGAAKTPNNIRSVGTRNVVSAMKKHGIKRLVVQSTYGIGATQGRLGFVDQLFFNLILKPQIEDTKLQEHLVRESGLHWTLAQPVRLTDEQSHATPFVSDVGETAVMRVARRSVASFLSQAALGQEYAYKSVALSGVPS